MIDRALPEANIRSARSAIARLGLERLRESYFTTFWLPRGEAPRNPVEAAVGALWEHAAAAAPVLGLEEIARRGSSREPAAGLLAGCSGAEWWIGRSYTTSVPVGFHFDQDVKARRGLRHPLLSSVFFFNAVRGGHLAITDQVPGRGGRPLPAEPTRLQAVKPRRNRYALFRGDRFHGVLDARGRTPSRPLPGPAGRLRVTLVVNFWQARPSDVPEWSETRLYRALAGG